MCSFKQGLWLLKVSLRRQGAAFRNLAGSRPHLTSLYGVIYSVLPAVVNQVLWLAEEAGGRIIVGDE